jgi:hypothetical protein
LLASNEDHRTHHFALDSHLVELGLIAGAGFGGIVGDEEYALAEGSEVLQDLVHAGNQVVSLPENPVAIKEEIIVRIKYTLILCALCKLSNHGVKCKEKKRVNGRRVRGVSGAALGFRLESEGRWTSGEVTATKSQIFLVSPEESPAPLDLQLLSSSLWRRRKGVGRDDSSGLA